MSDEQKKDPGMQGTEDIVKGRMKQAAGKVQSAFGKATGNKVTELKGDAQQVEGAAQVAKGKVERKVDETAGKAERKVDDTLEPPERAEDV